MTIYGIFGGIGSGKTLAMTWQMAHDALIKGRKLLSNISLDIPNTTIITPSIMEETMEGEGPILVGHTMGIDEIHNFLDSRASGKKKNQIRSHFILQSRHAGEEDLDIVYTTQFIHQVDRRLRENTDVKVYPSIIEWEDVTVMKGGEKTTKRAPRTMLLVSEFKLNHKMVRTTELIDVSHVRNLYNTHEIVKGETV